MKLTRQTLNIGLTFSIVCGIIIIGYRSCQKLPKGSVSINAPIRFVASPSNHFQGQFDTKPPKVPYVPTEGRVDIILKESTKTYADVFDIKVRQYGFTARPGFQVAVSGRLGLDIKYFYYNRLGLNFGVLTTKDLNEFSFDPTVSYKLDRIKIFKNLEVFAGYDTKYDGPTGGLRINL